MKRFLRHGLIFKLFLTLLFAPACTQTPQQEVPKPAPYYSTKLKGDWWLIAECVVQKMDKNSVTNWPNGTVQGVWPEKHARRATVPVRRSNDMTTLYTVTIFETGEGEAQGEIDIVPHQRDVYADRLEQEMKDALATCGSSAI